MSKIDFTSRFLIVGTGGIGGYYGGLLAKKGYDVTFLARGDHFEAMSTKGLTVYSVKMNFTVNPVKVVNNLDNIESPDVVLFCVKSYDNKEAATSLAKAISQDTIIISIQNGVTNDQFIKSIVELPKVYPGLAHIISSRTSPGVIEQKGGPRTIIFGDRINPQNEDLAKIANLMQLADIDATASRNIIGDMWEKFIFITSFSGFTALCRSNIGKIINDNRAYDVYKRSLIESINTAKASGVELSDSVYDNVIKRTEKYRGGEEGATSSLMRDLQAGNRTEIDSLSGTIVELAKLSGVDVPIHKLIHTAVALASK